MFEKEAEEYREKKKNEGYYWVTQEMEQSELDTIVDESFKDGAEFGYNKVNEEFKICEQNADDYYDKLQKAKRIIQEFLELNYSEFTKTNAVFLHADKFLKESK
jgi:hypothetical protein